MNNETQTNIDEALANYLDMLRDGQEDVIAAYKTTDTVAYMKAIERHECMTHSIMMGVDALSKILVVGEEIKGEA